MAVSEALVIARLILDIMDLAKKRGVDVSVETLEDEIARREKKVKDLQDKLGI